MMVVQATHTPQTPPANHLFTTQVDSEWVVGGGIYPRMQLHVEKVVLKSQSWAAALQI